MIDALRTAARAWLRTPGLFALNLVVLATGVAGAVSLFILVQTVLINPLPYPDDDRLVTVSFTAPGIDIERFEQSPGTYVHFSEQTRDSSAKPAPFEHFGIYTTEEVALTGDHAPRRLLAARTSPATLSALRVTPLKGRLFRDQEASRGSRNVALVSYRVWRDQFSSKDEFLGQSIRVDGVDREVIGVLRRDFSFPSREVDLWLPLQIDRKALAVTNFSFAGIARLSQDSSINAATERLRTLTQSLPLAYPEDLTSKFIADSGMQPLIEPFRDAVIGSASRALWIALAACGLVLLIAAANVLNLLLVRADARSSESALRAALGASRKSLLLRALADGITIGLPAGLMAGGASMLILHQVRNEASFALPRLHELNPGFTTVGLALVCGLVAGATLGIASGWRLMASIAGGVGGSGDLRGTRGLTASRSSWTTRRAFVVVQVAASTALLLAAGLLIRSFSSLSQVDPGFQPDRFVSLFVTLPEAEYSTAQRSRRFWEQAIKAIDSRTGVESAAVVSKLPFEVGGQTGTLVEEHPSPDGLAYVFGHRVASRDYFSTALIPILAGRSFTEDEERRSGAVVVSAALAHRFWSDPDSAIGKRLRPAGSSEDGRDLEWSTIVGVVGDLRGAGLRELSNPTVYLPLSFDQNRFLRSQFLVVRTATDQQFGLDEVRSALASVDPDVPVARYRTGTDLIASETVWLRFMLVLLATSAACATVIGSFGLFAMLLTLVNMRRREIGIRMAVGATTAEIRRLISHAAFVLVATGALAGFFLSLGLSKALASMLFEVSVLDPLTLLPVAGLLLAVAGLSALLPAKRAAKVDPITELRADTGFLG